MQVQCPSSLIENNVIENVYRGIELSGLLHYNEGPPPYNVVLRNNTIKNVNIGIKSSFMTVNFPPAVTAPIADVLVESNRLENVSHLALQLGNVSDAVIRDNHFIQCRNFRVGTSEDISFSGNRLDGHPLSDKDVEIKNGTQVRIKE